MNSLITFQVLIIVIVSQLNGCVPIKECTNIPTDLSSHTVRHELLMSNNETWKNEMFSHYHVTPTDDSAWSNLFPRKMLKEEGDEKSWAMMYRKIKNSAVGAAGGLLNEVSLHDVRLEPGSVHGAAQQTNLEYLLMLDVDRLVWSFRKTAGLETIGDPYGGWEDPKMELRGHFVGHYLSATAQMWASTHNDTLKEKMSTVVSVLSECQQKTGSGYLSAFPSEFFDRFEIVQPVWAPYYTIHKVLAGLLDQYTLAGNEQALKMTVSMVSYFYQRVQNVITKYTVDQHYRSLNEETGGMNDFLYKLYSVTGDPKHLLLAHLFDKPCFLGLLAVKAEDLSGFHSNTHIPIVVGSQMRYEVTGDPLYKEIGMFFMDVVNSSYSYATGGTSAHEFWYDPKRLADNLGTENEESCATYNMLKISRHLFTWTKEVAYADYYERALTNGVLSIQRGREPGVMIYMLPLGRGVSKAKSYHGWGSHNDSFWCCYGTGAESFSKLGDSIYFEERGKNPALYIIQYISSSLNWKTGGLSLSQHVEKPVSWDQRLQVAFTITSKEKSATGTSTLNFRVPQWTHANGAKASLNGQDLPLAAPGNFLSVSRDWSSGDKLTLDLPMSLRTEALKDDRPRYGSLNAILYGPYLLVGLSEGDWDIKANPSTSPSDYITPIPSDHNSHLISLMQQKGPTIFAVRNVNQSLILQDIPETGTDPAIKSSFRLVLKDGTKISKPRDAIGELVMLEPFDYPGMVIVHYGDGQDLGIADASKAGGNSVFRLASGLDGSNTTVSFQLVDNKQCYIYTDDEYVLGTSVKLKCTSPLDYMFHTAARFIMGKGFSEYHPMSFVAKGVSRNFVLSPLLSLKDEYYTAYFNMSS